MGKSEILMLIAGIVLSIMLALISIPIFKSSEDLIYKTKIFQEIKNIRDIFEIAEKDGYFKGPFSLVFYDEQSHNFLLSNGFETSSISTDYYSSPIFNNSNEYFYSRIGFQYRDINHEEKELTISFININAIGDRVFSSDESKKNLKTLCNKNLNIDNFSIFCQIDLK